MKTENENAAKLVRSDDLLDAGSVTASDIRYVVTIPHNHKTLKSGDVVVMTETPMRHNLLIRISDMTLHRLTDEYDQYVHLSESSNADFERTARSDGTLQDFVGGDLPAERG